MLILCSLKEGIDFLVFATFSDLFMAAIKGIFLFLVGRPAFVLGDRREHVASSPAGRRWHPYQPDVSAWGSSVAWSSTPARGAGNPSSNLGSPMAFFIKRPAKNYVPPHLRFGDTDTLGCE